MKTRKKNHHRPFMANGQATRNHPGQKKDAAEVREFSGFIHTDLGHLLAALSGSPATGNSGAPCPIHFNGHSVNLGPIVCWSPEDKEPMDTAHNVQLMNGYEKLLTNREEEVKQLKQRIQKLEKKIALEEYPFPG